MNSISLRVEKKEIGFFIPYVIYLVAYIFSMSFYYQHYISHMKPLIVCMLGILIVREFFGAKPDRKEWIAIFVCAAILVIELLARNESMLTAGSHVIFIYCARKIPFRKLAGWSAIIISCALFAVFISSQLGIIENYIPTIAEPETAGIRYREYLGFLYALYPSVFYFSAICLFVYYLQEKISYIGLLLLAAGSVFFYLKTDSRLSFGFGLLLLIIALFMKLFYRKKNRGESLCQVPGEGGSSFYRKKRPGRILWILQWAFMICAVLSFAFMVLYAAKVPFAVKLNLLLSKRIFYSYASMKLFGFGLIGAPVEWVGNGLSELGIKEAGRYIFVDNLYIHMLQFDGLIYALLYILLNTASMVKIYKRNDAYLLIILGLLAAYGLIDNLMGYLFFCPFWFVISTELIGGPLIRRKKEKQHV